MKLTAFTDYSLRVLMFLAADPDRRATISEIATAFEVSEHHLTKVVHFLAKSGWISTLRGKGGGMLLAMPASEISIGRVVRDTEGTAMPAECFSDAQSHCAIVACCQLKGVLAAAVNAFYGELDRYTLADIARNKAKLSNILHFQQPEPSSHKHAQLHRKA